MHQSVRHYFKLRKEGKVAFDDLSQFYLRSWKNVGFEDPYQEETYKKSGLSQLREFTDRHNAMPIAADGVRMEVHFELEMQDVVLEGRIDQINPVKPAEPKRGGTGGLQNRPAAHAEGRGQEPAAFRLCSRRAAPDGARAAKD